MNLHWIDWTIVTCLFVFITAMALCTGKYMTSVADFLAANRCAGRYLLCVAQGAASMGTIGAVACWEMYYEAGFTPLWWAMMGLPIGMIIATTGYLIYRYRQTKAMTLAQFFEIRYSRNFRIFAGFIAFTSGVLNFGVFPAVGTRFFMYFCQLPSTIPIFGYGISSFALIMIFLVSVSVWFTYMGGQITVIITDFFQGLFCNVAFLVLVAFIFLSIDWSDIGTALASAPAGRSLVNPLHGGKIENFNVWYFLVGVGTGLFVQIAWQGSQAYNCSATSPHEAKMAGLLGYWRGVIQGLALVLLPILAYMLMHHPAHTLFADGVNQTLQSIANKDDRNTMTVPVVLAHFLPIGLRGILCAVMLMAFISNHSTYLHSWGSILLQDVIMPFRKKPFKQKQHLLFLRLSIIFVAVFIIFFSLLFSQTQNILMYFALTGTIYLSGAGPVIVGGLYWKRGTVSGAWGAMITGAVMAAAAFFLREWWPKWYGHRFPINSQYLYAMAMGSAILVYAILSLLENKIFNMDRMLHRGKYASNKDQENDDNVQKTPVLKAGIFRLMLNKLGMTEEFTSKDKIIFFAFIAWNLGWWFIFIAGVVYGHFSDPADSSWFSYWKTYAWIMFFIGGATTIWFAIGGSINMMEMLARLLKRKDDEKDDGMVINHYNRDKEIDEVNSVR